MKTRPNLNKLAKEVHEANKAKGFHDEEHSTETLLMLVITELAEAVEADRYDNRSLSLEDFYDELEMLEDADNYNDLTFSETFENYIKDTLEDELADATLRLLDLAGLRELDLDDILEHFDSKGLLLPEGIFWIINNLIDDGWEYEWIEQRISEAIASIENLCSQLNIDLWLHVELKMKYNQTRPPKHGKRY